MKTNGASEKEIEIEILKEIPLGKIGTSEEFGAVLAFSLYTGYILYKWNNLPVDGKVCLSLKTFEHLNNCGIFLDKNSLL